MINENHFQSSTKAPHYHHIRDSLCFNLSKDFPINLPTKKVFVQFFFGKSMAEGYPTSLQFGHMSKIS